MIEIQIIPTGHNVTDAKTPLLQTPLHVACKAGASKVAHLLSRWDADSPIGLDICHHKDIQGKTPLQLLPRKASAACCDTLWSVCRSGHATRAAELLNKAGSSNTAFGQWEEVEGTGADLHHLAVSLDLTFNLGGSAGGDDDKNDPNHPRRRDDEEEEDDAKEEKIEEKADDRGVGRSTKAKIIRVPRLKPSSGGQELWLVNGIDAKTRRLRWSPLHACIIGWAEHRALIHLKEKASRGGVHGWNQPVIPLAKFHKERRGEGIVTASACRALGLTKESLSNGSLNVSTSIEKTSSHHHHTLVLLVKRQAFLDCLDVNCRTPLMLAAACNLTGVNMLEFVC